MLRAVSALGRESQALEVLSIARRDVYKVFRKTAYSTSTPASQTVLTKEASNAPAPPTPPPRHDPPPPPRPPQQKQTWSLAAAAMAVTAGIGGVYMYKKMNHEITTELPLIPAPEAKSSQPAPKPYPALGSDFPQHVQYLIAGAGTAAFAAMRAIRSIKPDAAVLMVGEEDMLPYMRPPLSKELWREKDLSQKADRPDSLTFRQWNGKHRNLIYEPKAFYIPVESLQASPVGGASVARGWKVTKLDVTEHTATLRADGEEVIVKYDKCLLAPGVKPRRSPALEPATRAGKSFTVRSIRDVRALAERVDAAKSVVLLGGGFLASELSAALADRTRDSGTLVYLVFKEEGCMQQVLPRYLCRDAATRLAARGVTLLTHTEVTSSSVDKNGRVHLRLTSTDPSSKPSSLLDNKLDGKDELIADVVIECLGVELEKELAEASGLEIHPTLGGIVVNTEMQARTDVYAAGDAACYHEAALGRRRVAHHDHAVLSGRLAGENMAGDVAKSYTHRTMFWSDLGPELGYEAVGLIDSNLSTVGVFSADAVSDVTTRRAVTATVQASSDDTENQLEVIANSTDSASLDATKQSASLTNLKETLVTSSDAKSVTSSDAKSEVVTSPDAASKRYERGVVFYLQEKRVVGVLLWNLFNRMHIARQVLAQGEFDDLFEVAKLFSPHEED